MDINQVKELIDKFNAGQCSEEEKALLETWYVENDEFSQELSPDMLATAVDRVWGKLQQSATPQPEIPNISHAFSWRMVAAASVLLFLIAGGYYWRYKTPKNTTFSTANRNDLAPGKEQATLTLANGSKIILTSNLSGKLAQQGNTLINVNAGHALAYTAGVPDSKITYNTLSTKNGEQSPLPLILADGSKVWLNAASSITFPVSFSGKDRTVTITGEAYLEVAHNERQPFRVITPNQTIEDLGTHFDVKAYDNEPALKTTLLEGSVSVSAGTHSVILNPGQQADLIKNDAHLQVKNVDIDGVIAWKNGRFHFDHADIQTVMREFARWYDVNVQYIGDIPAKAITGNINRNSKASVALQIIGILGVHYEIQGKTIIIKP
jgi:ferric-dicitrate binding protein FerR (iron transport regulator)